MAQTIKPVVLNETLEETIPILEDIRDAIGGRSSSDMTKAVYDPDNIVADAGGIVDYVDSVIVGGTEWGSITGNIANQTDLQNELDTKADLNDIKDATITIKQGGVIKGSFTTNQSNDATIVLESGSGGGGDAIWGSISGVLSNQTDLQTELDTKANITTTYTKSEVDTALNNKADTSTTLSGYGITDAYTKSEVDNALGDKVDESSRATSSDFGLVKVDGATIVSNNGVISAVGGTGSVTWGQITGTLSNQTDLKTALDGKADESSRATSSTFGLAKVDGTTITSNAGVLSAIGGTGSAAWGGITGILSNQIDLQSTLDNKANKIDTYTKSEVDSVLADKADIGDIPTVNNATVTVKQGASTKGSFTLNQGNDYTVELDAGSDMYKSAYATNSDNIVDTAFTLSGLTATVTELNYSDGVTSNIQTQLNDKVDVVSGKGLSANDYTTEEKTKLSGIADNAEVNTISSVDSDFSISSSKQLSLSNTVKNKLVEAVNPTLSGTETAISGLQIGSTKYKVGGGHDMVTGVSNVESLIDASENKVANAYTIKQYSNRYTTRVIDTLPANSKQITIQNSVFENDDATFEFMFEPNGTDTTPLILSSYSIITTAGSGSVTLNLESEPTVNTRVAVDVTIYRTN